jgi:hypothetical protein
MIGKQQQVTSQDAQHANDRLEGTFGMVRRYVCRLNFTQLPAEEARAVYRSHVITERFAFFFQEATYNC